MKTLDMRIDFRIVVFLFYILTSSLFAQIESPQDASGCTYHVTSSNGISLTNASSIGVYSINITKIDSVDFFLNGGGCGMSIYKFTRDYTDADYIVISQGQGGFMRIRALGLPGKYRFSLFLPSLFITSEFQFVLDLVTVKENSSNSALLKIYPNPARERIGIYSENENLKTISIKNALGQEIKNIDVSSYKVEIPLENLPSGIYFLNVTTISNKSSIRKIVIE